MSHDSSKSDDGLDTPTTSKPNTAKAQLIILRPDILKKLGITSQLLHAKPLTDPQYQQTANKTETIDENKPKTTCKSRRIAPNIAASLASKSRSRFGKNIRNTSDTNENNAAENNNSGEKKSTKNDEPENKVKTKLLLMLSAKLDKEKIQTDSSSSNTRAGKQNITQNVNTGNENLNTGTKETNQIKPTFSAGQGCDLSENIIVNQGRISETQNTTDVKFSTAGSKILTFPNQSSETTLTSDEASCDKLDRNKDKNSEFLPKGNLPLLEAKKIVQSIYDCMKAEETKGLELINKSADIKSNIIQETAAEINEEKLVEAENKESLNKENSSHLKKDKSSAVKRLIEETSKEETKNKKSLQKENLSLPELSKIAAMEGKNKESIISVEDINLQKSQKQETTTSKRKKVQKISAQTIVKTYEEDIVELLFDCIEGVSNNQDSLFSKGETAKLTESKKPETVTRSEEMAESSNDTKLINQEITAAKQEDKSNDSEEIKTIEKEAKKNTDQAMETENATCMEHKSVTKGSEELPEKPNKEPKLITLVPALEKCVEKPSDTETKETVEKEIAKNINQATEKENVTLKEHKDVSTCEEPLDESNEDIELTLQETKPEELNTSSDSEIKKVGGKKIEKTKIQAAENERGELKEYEIVNRGEELQDEFSKEIKLIRREILSKECEDTTGRNETMKTVESDVKKNRDQATGKECERHENVYKSYEELLERFNETQIISQECETVTDNSEAKKIIEGIEQNTNLTTEKETVEETNINGNVNNKCEKLLEELSKEKKIADQKYQNKNDDNKAHTIADKTKENINQEEEKRSIKLKEYVTLKCANNNGKQFLEEPNNDSKLVSPKVMSQKIEDEIGEIVEDETDKDICNTKEKDITDKKEPDKIIQEGTFSQKIEKLSKHHKETELVTVYIITERYETKSSDNKGHEILAIAGKSTTLEIEKVNTLKKYETPKNVDNKSKELLEESEIVTIEELPGASEEAPEGFQKKSERKVSPLIIPANKSLLNKINCSEEKTVQIEDSTSSEKMYVINEPSNMLGELCNTLLENSINKSLNASTSCGLMQETETSIKCKEKKLTQQKELQETSENNQSVPENASDEPVKFSANDELIQETENLAEHVEDKFTQKLNLVTDSISDESLVINDKLGQQTEKLRGCSEEKTQTISDQKSQNIQSEKTQELLEEEDKNYRTNQGDIIMSSNNSEEKVPQKPDETQCNIPEDNWTGEPEESHKTVHTNQDEIIIPSNNSDEKTEADETQCNIQEDKLTREPEESHKTIHTNQEEIIMPSSNSDEKTRADETQCNIQEDKLTGEPKESHKTVHTNEDEIMMPSNNSDEKTKADEMQSNIQEDKLTGEPEESNKTVHTNQEEIIIPSNNLDEKLTQKTDETQCNIQEDKLTGEPEESPKTVHTNQDEIMMPSNNPDEKTEADETQCNIQEDKCNIQEDKLTGEPEESPKIVHTNQDEIMMPSNNSDEKTEAVETQCNIQEDKLTGEPEESPKTVHTNQDEIMMPSNNSDEKTEADETQCNIQEDKLTREPEEGHKTVHTNQDEIMMPSNNSDEKTEADETQCNIQEDKLTREPEESHKTIHTNQEEIIMPSSNSDEKLTQKEDETQCNFQEDKLIGEPKESHKTVQNNTLLEVPAEKLLKLPENRVTEKSKVQQQEQRDEKSGEKNKNVNSEHRTLVVSNSKVQQAEKLEEKSEKNVENVSSGQGEITTTDSEIEKEQTEKLQEPTDQKLQEKSDVAVIQKDTDEEVNVTKEVKKESSSQQKSEENTLKSVTKMKKASSGSTNVTERTTDKEISTVKTIEIIHSEKSAQKMDVTNPNCDEKEEMRITLEEKVDEQSQESDENSDFSDDNFAESETIYHSDVEENDSTNNERCSIKHLDQSSNYVEEKSDAQKVTKFTDEFEEKSSSSNQIIVAPKISDGAKELLQVEKVQDVTLIKEQLNNPQEETQDDSYLSDSNQIIPKTDSGYNIKATRGRRRRALPPSRGADLNPQVTEVRKSGRKRRSSTLHEDYITDPRLYYGARVNKIKQGRKSFGSNSKDEVPQSESPSIIPVSKNLLKPVKTYIRQTKLEDHRHEAADSLEHHVNITQNLTESDSAERKAKNVNIDPLRLETDKKIAVLSKKCISSGKNLVVKPVRISQNLYNLKGSINPLLLNQKEDLGPSTLNKEKNLASLGLIQQKNPLACLNPSLSQKEHVSPSTLKHRDLNASISNQEGDLSSSEITQREKSQNSTIISVDLSSETDDEVVFDIVQDCELTELIPKGTPNKPVKKDQIEILDDVVIHSTPSLILDGKPGFSGQILPNLHRKRPNIFLDVDDDSEELRESSVLSSTSSLEESFDNSRVPSPGLSKLVPIGEEIITVGPKRKRGRAKVQDITDPLLQSEATITAGINSEEETDMSLLVPQSQSVALSKGSGYRRGKRRGRPPKSLVVKSSSDKEDSEYHPVKKRGLSPRTPAQGHLNETEDEYHIKKRSRPTETTVQELPDETGDESEIHLDQEKEKVGENMVAKKKIKLITCGVCHEKMKYTSWPHHKTKHNFLCWKVGQPSVDFTDRRALTNFILKSLKGKKHVFVCPECGDRKKSVVGFLSHKDACQKSEEERLALREACPVCGRKMLPASLKVHMSVHRPKKYVEPVVEKVEPVINTEERFKRKAAARAAGLIQEVSNDENAKNMLSSFCRRMHELSRFQMSMPLQQKYMRALKADKIISCTIKNCKFTSNKLEDLKSHIRVCGQLKKNDILCRYCLFVADNDTDMIDHTRTHTNDDEFKVEDDLTKDDDSLNGDDEIGFIEKKRPLESKSNYKVKFLMAEGRLLPSVISTYPATKKWTLQYCQENYSKELFKNYKGIISDWSPISVEEEDNYLPLLKKSVSVKSEFMSKTVPELQGREHIFTQYHVFETHLADDVITIFCGGPVWALAWVPTPEYFKTNQYLAVSTQRQYEATYKMSKAYPEEEMIQFWNFGKLNNKSKLHSVPKLEFCLAHDHGMVWCMEWCPSGCYDEEEPNDTFALRRLGLLALACADGNILIYSICFPEGLDTLFNNGRNIFRTKEQFRLILGDPVEQQLGSWNYQATKLSWSKGRGHNVIAGGYSNGVVCIWDLSQQSPLLKSEENGTVILKPYYTFQPHTAAITVLSLHPHDGGKRWLLTGSWDRTSKYWDLIDTSAPISESCKRGLATDGVWMSHWLCSFITYDDVFNLEHTVTSVQNVRDFCYKQSSALPTNSMVTSLSANDWANGIAQGSIAGEICASFPRQVLISYDGDKGLKCKRLMLGYTELIEKDKTPEERLRKQWQKIKKQQDLDLVEKDDKYFLKYFSSKDDDVYEEEPSTYEETQKKYGLIFCNFDLSSFSNLPSDSLKWVRQSNRLHESPTELYPIMSVNRVQWNPNKQAYLFLASGYHAGFVRLQCVRFLSNKYCEM